MELLIGAAVVLLLLFCLGVSGGFISILIGVVIGMGVLFMLGLFVFSAVRLIRSEKRTARFEKIEKPEGAAFERAVYNVDGESCPNVYPCEAVMRNKLYREDKEVQVRYYAKKKCVYDRNAVITTVIGLIFSLVVTGAALYIFLIFRG